MKKIYLHILTGFLLCIGVGLYASPLQVWIDPADDTVFICQDNEQILNGYFNGGVPPYTWYWTGNTTYLDDPYAQTVTFTGSVPGTFRLWYNVRDGNGTISSDSIVIVVKPKPILNITGPNLLCVGQTATLTATGATTYFWFDNLGNLIGVGSPFNVSPTSTTQYTLVGVKNGCANSIYYTITTVQPPTVQAGPSDTICAGENFVLSFSIASNYDSLHWFTSGDGYFSNPYILHPTYYPGINDRNSGTVVLTLVAHGKSPCSNVSSSLTLTIQSPNPVHISGDSIICQGNGGTLSATPGDTYQWNTGQTTSSIFIAPAVSMWYSVTAIFGACVSHDSIWVEVRPKPLVQIHGDSDICVGEATFLQASGAATYQWSTGDTLSFINVSPSSSTVYSVTGFLNGCSNSASIQVNVHLPPNVQITPNSSICYGDSITLQASGALYYLWSTGATSSSITVSPTSSEMYYLTASDDYCQVFDSVQVTVKPLPVVNLGPDTLICPGDGIWLNAGLADSYTWSTGQTSSSIYVTPSSSTNYSVTATSNGCSASDEIQIGVKILPPITITHDTTLCHSETVLLEVSGGDHYLWNTGDTTTQIQVTPTSTTTYFVQVIVNGCTVWKSVTITILNLPQFSVAGPTQICEGNAATLTATGASSYAWSTGETTSSITVSPMSTTTYHITAYDGGCSATADFTVQVNPIPQVSLGNDTTICPNNVVILDAGLADSYQWNTGQTSATISVSPSTSTYYEVTITINGCQGSDGVWVNVYALPPMTVSNDTSICAGSTLTLSASGGDSYHWSTGENASTIVVSPLSSTTFYVTITSGICPRVDSVHVQVNPLPNLSEDSVHVCEGNDVILDPGLWNAYLWNNGDTAPIQTFQPSQDTSVWVSVTNAYGCSAEKHYFIDVVQRPILTLQPLYNACEGSNLTICATGADSYTWSNGMVGFCITLTPASSFYLYVTGTKDGCSSLDSTYISFHPSIVVNLPQQVLMIEGDTVLLCGDIAGDSLASLAWSDGSSILPETDTCINISPSTTTTFYLTAYSTSGCMGEDSTIVYVFPPGIYANLMHDTTICSGDSLQLWVNVYLSSSPNLHYQWVPAEGLSNDAIPNPLWYATTSRWFHVTITDDEGHVYNDSVFITVIKRPTVYLGNDTAVCQGAVLMFGDINMGYHLWNTGDTTDSIQITANQSMWVSLLVNNQGCISKDSVYVNVIVPPSFDVGPDREICQGDSIAIPVYFTNQIYSTKEVGIMYIKPTGDTTIYYYLFWNGCPVSDELHVVVHPRPVFELISSTSTYLDGQPVLIRVNPAIYEQYYFYKNSELVSVNSVGEHYYDDLRQGDIVRVVVENEAGCMTEKFWQGLWHQIPTAFTPNNNGQNDRFMPGVHQKIFNRWGQLLYEGSEGWDGTFDGKTVSEGTYYYLIEFTNPEKGTIKTYSGSVLLIR
jgi:gliding motility-associated-like protein